MKIITIALIIGLLTVTAKAKPTFDVIADIIHDLVHDPNQPPNHRPPQYGYNGAYNQNAYNRPVYNQAGYGYNQRPPHQGGYQHNSPNVYYPNNQQVGYYPPSGNFGQNAVYDNQGYYKGPPYAANQPSGYNYNNGYSHPPPQYGYKNRGY
ncbi:hypothetical protein FF38_07856 [Lucilia cuprina]|uniref:Uncharacterized protein n=1 Tax=Lucilia cuprina TaxID=7375 RepID=A0A0L0C079_LUCCU|nr:hypothetical protein FF38_07856 [Lucilia cuprina]